MLAGVYAAAIVVGAIDGKKVGVFAPWFLLYITGLLATTRFLRSAAFGLALAFGTGWLGILTGLWPATYRYLEPLDEVAANVVALARPGDLVVCEHPSFYFHVRYLRMIAAMIRNGAT